MAAAMAIFQSLAPGDHVVAPAECVLRNDPKLLRDVFVRWDLEVDFVDMTKLDTVKKAVRQQTQNCLG